MEVVAGFGDPGIIVVTRHAGPWMKDAKIKEEDKEIAINAKKIFVMMMSDDVSPVWMCQPDVFTPHTLLYLSSWSLVTWMSERDGVGCTLIKGEIAWTTMRYKACLCVSHSLHLLLSSVSRLIHCTRQKGCERFDFLFCVFCVYCDTCYDPVNSVIFLSNLRGLSDSMTESEHQICCRCHCSLSSQSVFSLVIVVMPAQCGGRWTHSRSLFM